MFAGEVDERGRLVAVVARGEDLTAALAAEQVEGERHDGGSLHGANLGRGGNAATLRVDADGGGPGSAVRRVPPQTAGMGDQLFPPELALGRHREVPGARPDIVDVQRSGRRRDFTSCLVPGGGWGPGSGADEVTSLPWQLQQ